MDGWKTILSFWEGSWSTHIPPTSIGVSGLAGLGDFDGFDKVAALVEVGHIRARFRRKNHDDPIMNIRKKRLGQSSGLRKIERN